MPNLTGILVCAFGRNMHTGKIEPLSLGGAVIIGVEWELREAFGSLVVDVGRVPDGRATIPLADYNALWATPGA